MPEQGGCCGCRRLHGGWAVRRWAKTYLIVQLTHLLSASDSGAFTGAAAIHGHAGARDDGAPCHQLTRDPAREAAVANASDGQSGFALAAILIVPPPARSAELAAAVVPVCAKDENIEPFEGRCAKVQDRRAETAKRGKPPDGVSGPDLRELRAAQHRS